jgi:uncharacterized protein
MTRSVRNRLTELLLRAFADRQKGDAILWLGLFCTLVGRAKLSEIPLADLLAEGKAIRLGEDGGLDDRLADLIGNGRLLRLRRADTNEEMGAGLPCQTADVPWVIGPALDVSSALTAVCERVRLYADVLSSYDGMGIETHGTDPVRRTVVQAAVCFNAGLFFEAHEHLEQIWQTQPTGPTKRFLQGIIQISVGFHHAQRGSHDGAVNQLGKGLEKTAGLTGEVLGLDCDAFLPAVARSQKAIVACGRGAMRPMPLVEVPRMRVLGVGPSGGKSARRKDRWRSGNHS